MGCERREKERGEMGWLGRKREGERGERFRDFIFKFISNSFFKHSNFTQTRNHAFES
jgi:hypothetical protein